MINWRPIEIRSTQRIDWNAPANTKTSHWKRQQLRRHGYPRIGRAAYEPDTYCYSTTSLDRWIHSIDNKCIKVFYQVKFTSRFICIFLQNSWHIFIICLMFIYNKSFDSLIIMYTHTKKLNSVRLLLNKLKIYCNEEKTRTFLSLSLHENDAIAKYDLCQFVDRLDGCLNEFNLPPFYEVIFLNTKILS